MATKYRAVCKSCNFKGNTYLNPITAKMQRSKHQIDTNFEHNVGIEITEEVVTFIKGIDIDNTDEKNINKLFKLK